MNVATLEKLTARIVKECRNTEKSEREIVETTIKAYKHSLHKTYGKIAEGIRNKKSSSRKQADLFTQEKSVNPLSKKVMFGKFKGKTFKWVRDNAPWYWTWMEDQGILKKNKIV